MSDIDNIRLRVEAAEHYKQKYSAEIGTPAEDRADLLAEIDRLQGGKIDRLTEVVRLAEKSRQFPYKFEALDMALDKLKADGILEDKS